MAITIASNIPSIKAQNSLARSSEALGSVYQRLSSGLRINKASDDAASLAVSQTTHTDRAVFGQAIRNTNDGISLLNIADSTVGQLSDIVTRLKELAEQGANGVFGRSQRIAINAEAQQLSQEYFRISRSATFNGLNLFDGSIQNVALQGGYGTNGILSSGLGGKLGTGSVTLSQSVGITTSVSSATADINGDGNVDLVIGNSTSSQVEVYAGNGDGTFSGSAMTLDVGASSGRITLGDFNNDGAMDIATIRSAGGLDILLNNGNGTFKAAISTSVSVTATAGIAVGDFNGDGKSDVVITGNTQDQILLGAGDGTFQALSAFSNGLSATNDFKVGDVNNDGIADLIMAGDSGGPSPAFTVALGAGNGTFGTATVFSGVGLGPLGSMAIGDLNNDGKLDVVVGSSTLGSVGIYSGNGNGTFSNMTTFSASGLINIGGLSVADLNGDGKQDVIINGSTGGSSALDIYSGDGRGGVSLTSTVSGVGTSRNSTADVNNDGVPDVLVLTSGAAETKVLTSNTQNGIAPLLAMDLTTQVGALQALPQISRALDALTLQRGIIGAFQSRAEVATRTLQSTSTDLAGAESRLVDADLAQEAANLTRLGILQQAGVAVLTQANIQPQIALTLLQHI